MRPTTESGLFNPRHFKLAAAIVLLLLLWLSMLAALFAISNRIQVDRNQPSGERVRPVQDREI